MPSTSSDGRTPNPSPRPIATRRKNIPSMESTAHNPGASILPTVRAPSPAPRLTPVPVRQRLGLGEPTENPFFADIYVPSDVPFERVSSAQTATSTSSNTDGTSNGSACTKGRPVRVFIHGGFLQFGSTSGTNYNQQFFAAEHFGELRVLLGHRWVSFVSSIQILFPCPSLFSGLPIPQLSSDFHSSLSCSIH